MKKRNGPYLRVHTEGHTVSRHLNRLGLGRRRFIDPNGESNRKPGKIIAHWPVNHGQAGALEPVTALLRPRGRGWYTATNHITTRPALTQLPKKYQRGRRTLIRTDSAGRTCEFVA